MRSKGLGKQLQRQVEVSEDEAKEPAAAGTSRAPGKSPRGRPPKNGRSDSAPVELADSLRQLKVTEEEEKEGASEPKESGRSTSVHDEEDEKIVARRGAIGAKSQSTGGAPTLLLSDDLVVLLDSAMSSPNNCFDFKYASSEPPQYRSALRRAVSVQWETRPDTFSAEVTHVGRRATAGDTETTRLSFSLSKVRGVYDSDSRLPLWISRMHSVDEED